MSDTRTRRIRTDAAIAAVGMIVLLGLFLLALWVGRPSQPASGQRFSTPGGIILATLGTAVLAAWWGFWGFRIVRALDEYKQHVERASWFWGGLLGLMASVPVYSFIMFGGLHWLNPDRPVGRDLANAFAHGYMLPVFMQVAGALVVAMWMRFSRR